MTSALTRDQPDPDNSDPRSDPCGPCPGPDNRRLAPWSRLSELHRLLAAAAMAPDPDRWQNAQDLVARLAARGELPEEPAELRRLLAPLFCRSPEEQRRFADLFDQWFGEGARRAIAVTPRRTSVEPRPRRPPPRTSLRPVLLGLGALVLALAVGLWVWLKPGPEIPPPAPVSPKAAAQPTEPRTYEGPSDYLDLPLAPIPPRSPPEVLRPGPKAQRLLAVADWLIPVLPGLFLLGPLAWRWLRLRDVLRYRKGDADSPLRHITLDGEDDDLFTAPTLRAALRRLHTPVPVPTDRLDERATVEHSARRSGLFTPVYRDLPKVPELVVLVDFHHRGDHLAGLAETLVLRLREAGLEVHRYPYQRQPDRALGPRGQALGLPELAARHPGSRLLVVGDPAAFVDAWSGRAADWTEVLALWPRRALLMTRTIPDAWRPVLASTGLALAPFGEAGLIRLAGDLVGAPVPAVDLPESVLPPVLGQAAGQDDAPAPEAGRAILAGLDGWLGPRGGLLLAAVAVYPEAHPGLTRLLDHALFPADPPEARAQRLLRLARLPWLRAGRLPDWLRQALADATGRRESRRIGAVYRELLHRASVDDEASVRLPVAVPARRGGWWTRLRQALRERGLRPHRWVRDLVRGSGPDAALRDRIFLETVLRPRVLDFPLPRRLARLLPRPLSGAGWPALVTFILGAAFLGVAAQGSWSGLGPAAALGPAGGLRGLAADVLLGWEQAPNRAYRIEIRYIPRGDDPKRTDPASTQALAAALESALRRSGFERIELKPLLAAPAQAPAAKPAGQAPQGQAASAGGQPESPPAPAAPLNTVQFGAEAEPPQVRTVAARLQYLAWGAEPQITNLLNQPPPGAEAAPPPPGTIRVWLRTRGGSGAFTDPLTRPLTETERAAFRDPAGLRLPEPTRTAPRPLEVFRDRLRDGSEGPAMVALPGGTFRMGSPDTEPERGRDEGPQHEVTIRPFAMGRTEVTFAEYDRFAEATGRKKPDDRGWGRGDRPVINVTWNDATAYAAWLADQTGESYRLPSEAEWEYATRAGTETPFWSGDCIHTDQANYNGTYDYNGCGAKTGLYRQETVPAGSLPANPWGLHEVAGNVWEWVADCWHTSYQGAPSDGSAWGEAGGGDCARRVVRGGGWSLIPRWLRSADRGWSYPGGAYDFRGFRLARTP
jgi:formylglycine-generating enzyme required for sulfatase activity